MGLQTYKKYGKNQTKTNTERAAVVRWNEIIQDKALCAALVIDFVTKLI